MFLLDNLDNDYAYIKDTSDGVVERVKINDLSSILNLGISIKGVTDKYMYPVEKVGNMCAYKGNTLSNKVKVFTVGLGIHKDKKLTYNECNDLLRLNKCLSRKNITYFTVGNKLKYEETDSILMTDKFEYTCTVKEKSYSTKLFNIDYVVVEPSILPLFPHAIILAEVEKSFSGIILSNNILDKDSHKTIGYNKEEYIKRLEKLKNPIGVFKLPRVCYDSKFLLLNKVFTSKDILYNAIQLGSKSIKKVSLFDIMCDTSKFINIKSTTNSVIIDDLDGVFEFNKSIYIDLYNKSIAKQSRIIGARNKLTGTGITCNFLEDGTLLELSTTKNKLVLPDSVTSLREKSIRLSCNLEYLYIGSGVKNLNIDCFTTGFEYTVLSPTTNLVIEINNSKESVINGVVAAISRSYHNKDFKDGRIRFKFTDLNMVNLFCILYIGSYFEVPLNELLDSIINDNLITDSNVEEIVSKLSNTVLKSFNMSNLKVSNISSISNDLIKGVDRKAALIQNSNFRKRYMNIIKIIHLISSTSDMIKNPVIKIKLIQGKQNFFNLINSSVDRLYEIYNSTKYL